MSTGLFHQFKVLLKRNLILKKRMKSKTITEFIMPITMTLIIVVFRLDQITYKGDIDPIGNVPLNYSLPLLSYKNFGVSPNNSDIKNLIDSVMKELMPHFEIQISWFETEEELERQFNLNSSAFQVGIVFVSNSSYKLRYPSTVLPHSSDLYGSQENCRGNSSGTSIFLLPVSVCPAVSYVNSGFSLLQSTIDRVLFQKWTKNELQSDAMVQLYPKEKYIKNQTTVKTFIPLYLIFAFTPLISILTLLIVTEKEKKIKEGMLMMGMNITSYWLAWFVTEALMAFLISVLMTVIIFATNVLPNTSIIIIFTLIILFAISTILLSFMLTPFFNNAKVAGSVMGLVLILLSLFYFLAIWLENKVDTVIFFILALLSPTAFTLGFEKVVSFDIEGPVSWNQMSLGKFSINNALIMLSVDIVLYALLAFYFDCVIPGKYGKKQKPWFFFMPSYWFPENIDTDNFCKEQEVYINIDNSADIEPIPLEMENKKGIRISNITKIFKNPEGKNIKAVNDLTFTIYEGQITALLGHNGAGKTTLLNMLNGILSPSSGTASVYGFNICIINHLAKIRSMTGVCLQENILLDDLNAKEHFIIFARLKGIPENKIQSEVETMLCDVDLFENKLTPSKNLSGGQKRKLCVGIALIGNPKIIYLDEPTSGVDPFSRRLLWTFLQKKKEGRIIVLTTHSMDEADILADRKAIISKGNLKCAGSSLFLKNRFGIGYHLTFTLNNSMTDEHAIESLVKNVINKACFSRKTSLELSFVLPLNETEKFPQLFTDIDNAILENQYGIVSYGISMTTLEEVFLSLAKQEIDEDDILNEGLENDSLISDSTLTELTDVKPFRSFFQTVFAYLKIRFILFFREPGHIFPIIATPIIMVIITYSLMSKTVFSVPQPLTITPSLYNTTFYYQNKTDHSLDIMDNALVDEQLNVNLLHENPNITNLQTSCMATVVNEFFPRYNWDFLINDTCIHSLPVLQNIISNMILKTNNITKSISVISHPLFKEDEIKFDPQTFSWLIIIGMCFAIVSPTIAVEVVEDRENRTKNQLEVAGLNFFIYWGCILFSHSVLFLTSMIIMIISLIIIKVEFLLYSDVVLALILLLIFYIPTSLLFCYNLCYLFNKHETAKSVLSIICSMPSLVLAIPIIVLDVSNNSLASILHYLFSILSPFYTIIGGMYYLLKASILQKLHEKIGFLLEYHSVFSLKNNVSILYVIMSIQIILYFLLLKVVDTVKSGRSISHIFNFNYKTTMNNKKNTDFPEEEDDDVKKERERVHNIGNDVTGFAIIIKELRKVYEKKLTLKDSLKKIAVRNLSFAIDTGNIFGLLGPNGAGKTSVIKMITIEEIPTCGNITLAGFNVTFESNKAFQEMGYCPQFDALWKKLTVEEHLHLFAALRGIPKAQISPICKKLLSLLHITNFAKQKISKLSGGTKRKVCFIISILGSPTAVLLDEPSTGLDPQAKRYLWNLIQNMFPINGNRSILFTTHSMEEADALCTKVGVMVKGTLRCLGSVQHLKNKYGIGYTLDIKIKRDSDDSYTNKDNVKNFILKNFPLAVIKEEFWEKITYSIPQCAASLAGIFKLLEEAKIPLNIEEYSFSQTTLEQVFLECTKEQEQEEENKMI